MKGKKQIEEKIVLCTSQKANPLGMKIFQEYFVMWYELCFKKYFLLH
jgi:hypothetical protein